MTRIGVLISGRGSNLQSLIDATTGGQLDATIAVVISNREEAAGLDRARRAGIDTVVMRHRDWSSRREYDLALVDALRERKVDLVCLAGFMRLLSPAFIEAFPEAVLNIHPSLLPAFPGLHAQRQALEHGVKITGVTVHLVNGGLDDGPIVVQRPVVVHADDTEDTLSARILEQEHLAYPQAVALIISGGWRIDGRRVLPLRREASGAAE